MTKNTKKKNKDHFPCKGCVCGASSDWECGCDADWTPKVVYSLQDELSEIKKLVNELFGILEEIEESDEGVPFHPTTIRSCRIQTNIRLLKLLPELKERCNGRHEN